jgi:hypothetical protein
MVHSGVATFRESPPDVLDSLARAERAVGTAHMSHLAAACRHYRGSLLGGADGAALLRAAAVWSETEQVANPTRVFQSYAPGRLGP